MKDLFALFAWVCLGMMSCCCAHSVIFGSPSDHVSHEATIPVDPVCQRLAEEGSCAFYTCYENRHPCDERGFAMMHGFRYCNQYVQHYNSFNDEGKTWINSTYRCLTQSLAPLYERDTVSCAETSDMIDHVSRCFTENNFCSIFWENKSTFRELASSSGFLGRNALQYWRELLQIFGGCARQRLSTFSSWLGLFRRTANI